MTRHVLTRPYSSAGLLFTLGTDFSHHQWKEKDTLHLLLHQERKRKSLQGPGRGHSANPQKQPSHSSINRRRPDRTAPTPLPRPFHATHPQIHRISRGKGVTSRRLRLFYLAPPPCAGNDAPISKLFLLAIPIPARLLRVRPPRTGLGFALLPFPV
jgi:hypothetical protein